MPFLAKLALPSVPKSSTEPVVKDETGQFSKLWFLFFDSLIRCLGLLIQAIQLFFGVGPVITDTHANRTKYDPETYQRFPYFETDRQITYVSRQPAGLVNTAGTAVTLASVGDEFDASWVGLGIVINLIAYTIAAVGGPTGLTLSTSAGTQTGVSFAVQKNFWMYQTGIMHVVNLADLPGSLGTADAGFLADETQYEHCYKWNGSAWHFAKQDDHMAGQIAFSWDGNTPTAGVWAPCDGSTISISKGDGTVISATVPAIQGSTWIKGVAVGTTPASNAATRPKWDAGAVTDDESAHTHPLTTVPINFTTGILAIDVESLSVTGPGSAHHHALSDANAKLKAPSDTDGGEPLNMGVVFFVRQ